MDLKTARLYYEDSYQVEFRAQVVEAAEGGRRLYLDRTAFYPNSGGQPHDTGWIEGIPVQGVIEEGERIAHLVEAPVAAREIVGRIDWERRFDHMQQHTGQHLLSAVLLDLYGAPTVGFHMGAEISTIDLGIASLHPDQILRAEERANQLVFRNLPVRIHWEEAGAEPLRRAAPREGLLRVVTIEGVDRTACGGTHVRATGEIGAILIRKVDRAHGGIRLEFLCGMRAVRRARTDYEALERIARTLSASHQDAPRLVAEQVEALQKAEKARRKLATELAERRGRELYDAARPDDAGRRWALQRIAAGELDEELRTLARAFTARPGAVCLIAVEQPPALLVALSQDLGCHAGALLKEILAEKGGRGGGGATLGQGSAPDRAALETALRRLLDRLGAPSEIRAAGYDQKM